MELQNRISNGKRPQKDVQHSGDVQLEAKCGDAVPGPHL